MSLVASIDRVPPQNLEAEQGVLGSMLLDRDAIARVVELIRPEDFYRDAHRRIYETITELFERGEPVDLITATDRLRDKGQLDDVGGAAYVTALLNAIPTAANVEYYARIMLQKSMLRQMITAGTQIAQMGYEGDQDVEILVDRAEKLVFSIANRRLVQEFLPIREILKESFERIDRRYQDKGTVTGVATGFTDLDQITSGLQPSDLVIVAARPAMGKTTFAMNIAQHAAIHHQTPCAIFSLETSKEQLVQRFLCAEAEVDGSKLRTGFLSDADWPKLARAMGRLSEAPIFIDDSATISVIEMRAKARKLKAEHGLGLIVVDYLQMIQSYKRTENRTQEISEIARSLKSLAKELDIPLIAISQLSRAVEVTGTRRPMLSHLRECVTADTVVWDADTGRRHVVGELARQTEWPRLLSLDDRGKLVGIRPSAVWAKGENDVFEVRTSTGRRLRATANHPLLTPDGWMKVGLLQKSSRVAAARGITEAGLDGADSVRPEFVEGANAGLGRLPWNNPSVIARTSSAARGPKQSPAMGQNLPALTVLERPGSRLVAEGSGDITWDTVEEILLRGREPVFDLVMPGTHNFVASGLVVHNSGELEQVSDLVLFIYREDYYNPDTEKKNIAEIIIAKHRNGPIGLIEMFFHKEHSKFASLERRRV